MTPASIDPPSVDPHRVDPREPVRDLKRPRWTNWMVAGGVILFWAGFILWLFK